MSKGFQFKQFFVAHDQTAMKVNTDGILLGAIADIREAKQIIDMGTGTGLIALMLAQRSADDCQITALELEPKAYKQAVENVANFAKGRQKIRVIQTDVLNFEPEQKADLVVANPPYFAHSPKSRSLERDLARQACQSHLDWLNQAQGWLKPNGKISLILPYEAGENLLAQTDLACIERWEISTKAGQAPKRLVLTFSPQPQALAIRQLTIYDQANQYTPQFRALTKDFYLNM
ncbi:tRNA (adenosine(37)-N6)-methyltransferase TrmM [Pasteurellaceae bacterium RH1A]|nr:tRNA (adenosine(37)-N6)-methyltransferase TrmM [Pasteurellaceae bacterium RH1A]